MRNFQTVRTQLFVVIVGHTSSPHTESSLERLDAVQTRMIETERQLQAEIDALKEELRREQDPSRMQLIQEMISVCLRVLIIACIATS